MGTDQLATTRADIVSARSLVVGTSFGGSSGADIAGTLTVFPAAEAGRFYESGMARALDSSNASVVPEPVELWYSFKGAQAHPAAQVAAVASDSWDPSPFTAAYESWVASGRAIRWTYQHEADQPGKNIDPALFQRAWTKLLGLAPATELVTPLPIMMAQTISKGAGSLWHVEAGPVVGIDCYSVPHLAKAIAFVKTLGKHYVIPETGAGGPKDPKGSGDEVAQSFLAAMVAGWAADPPDGFCWFSSEVGGKSTYLRNLTGTTAALTTLADSTGAWAPG